MTTTAQSKPQTGDLRVWHIPQIGSKAGTFHVPVKTVEDGMLVMDVLANYDLFQFENNIKPDYANANGLERFDEADIDIAEGMDGWTDWLDEDGNDVDDLRRLQVLESVTEEEA